MIRSAGVGVKAGQGVGADCYLSVDGDLREPLSKQLSTPKPDILWKVQTVLALEHCYFPKRHGGYGELLATKRIIERPSCACSQAGVTGPQPDERMGVYEDHGFSTLSGLVSASHSTSMGLMMSPTIFIRPRSAPKNDLGRSR